jgi:hypothetical protein
MKLQLLSTAATMLGSSQRNIGYFQLVTGGAVIRKIFYPMLGHPLELSRPSTPQWIPPRKPILAIHTLDPSPIGGNFEVKYL